MGNEKVWTIEDVMIEDVLYVSPSTPFKRLVDLLWLNDVSALPVVDEADKLVGIVTESDLLARTEFRPESGNMAARETFSCRSSRRPPRSPRPTS